MHIYRWALLSALLCAAWPWHGATAAQCKSGDYQIGEDAHAIYCEKPLSLSELEKIGNNLRDLQADSSLVGDEWRFRKAMIDELGCLAKNHAVYRYGAKPSAGTHCSAGTQQIETDCSGALANSIESGSATVASAYSGCVVAQAYQRTGKELSGLLQKNARQQLQYFAQHGALRPPATPPKPGDAVFFERTTGPQNKYATHVAIYLGRNSKGEDLILHASSTAKRVAFGVITPWLKERLVGYGDVSKLFTATLDENKH